MKVQDLITALNKLTPEQQAQEILIFSSHVGHDLYKVTAIDDSLTDCVHINVESIDTKTQEWLDTPIEFPNFTFQDIFDKLKERELPTDDDTIADIAVKFEDDYDDMVVAGWNTLERIIDDM
jgi:hypothetical protein